MKITAFNGSPKAETSNTHVMVAAFLKGAESAGAQVENIFLVNKHINHCKGCHSCRLSADGKCVINDDMEELLSKYVASDIAILATPLYFETVSSVLKAFIDRSYCLGISTPPKIIAIANASSPHRSSFQTLSRTMNFFAKHSELIAEIYAAEGPVLTAKSSRLDPIRKEYSELLYKAGQEIVVNMKLSGETQCELEKPIIPIDDYLQGFKAATEKSKARYQ